MFISPLVLSLAAYTLVSTIAMIPLFIGGSIEAFFDSLTGGKKNSKKFEIADLALIVFFPGVLVIFAGLMLGAGIILLMGKTKRG